jgi:hypothetical protein
LSNPVLTAAPIQVDQTGEESGLAGTGVCSEGPYENTAGDVFLVLQTQNGPPFHDNIFERPAGSPSFTLKASLGNTTLSALLYCQFDKTKGTGAKGLITIARATGTLDPLTLRWATFDCGAGTVTDTVLPDLTDVIGAGGLPSIPFVTRANGDTLILYSNAALNHNVGFRVCSGGVWSSYTAAFAVAGHTYIAQGLYLDPSGTAIAIISDRVGGVTTWKAFTIDGANVVGALNTIAVATQSDVLNLGFIASDGNLYVPLVRGAGNSKASLFSAPSPAGAVWTVTDFQTALTNQIVTAGIIEDPTGTLLYFWQFEDASGTPNVVYVSSNVSGGGWGAKTVYYDVNAFPPNALPLNLQFVSQFNPAPGSTLSVMTMLTNPDEAFAAFFAGAPAPAPPPAVLSVAMVFCGVIRYLVRDTVKAVA